ncbi:M23 family metallopeptidase [Actinomadura fibrosa]|uniref:M23 family metallopeptidase n=1 Tax=Actinomadura fibrosa TaxID=111802 RepID=A0ABW2XMW1_9ACTN|nr:M23 family metallopeptidase [Actinomadura fibrosa]
MGRISSRGGGARRKIVLAAGGTVAVTGLAAAGVVAAVQGGGDPKPASAAAAAMPTFQLPFPCGQTWTGSNKSSAHTGYEIDFNWGTTGEADNGKPVVAAAAGTVIRSEYSTSSGYGNMVYIRHSGGYVTRYAHLKKRLVAVGASVAKGQQIGQVGNTSAKYAIISHLHYELRDSAGSQLPAYFEGRKFGYPTQTLTACGGAPSDPVASVCGSGFTKIDEAVLKKGATTLGRVYLGYGAGQNCVVTVKPKGAKAAMAATLQVEGATAKSDKGDFTWYAGPVKAAAASKCVKWGGTIDGVTYTSTYEHCA